MKSIKASYFVFVLAVCFGTPSNLFAAKLILRACGEGDDAAVHLVVENEDGLTLLPEGTGEVQALGSGLTIVQDGVVVQIEGEKRRIFDADGMREDTCHTLDHVAEELRKQLKEPAPAAEQGDPAEIAALQAALQAEQERAEDLEREMADYLARESTQRQDFLAQKREVLKARSDLRRAREAIDETEADAAALKTRISALEAQIAVLRQTPSEPNDPPLRGAIAADLKACHTALPRISNKFLIPRDMIGEASRFLVHSASCRRIFEDAASGPNAPARSEPWRETQRELATCHAGLETVIDDAFLIPPQTAEAVWLKVAESSICIDRWRSSPENMRRVYAAERWNQDPRNRGQCNPYIYDCFDDE